jgi:PKD repeat protein
MTNILGAFISVNNDAFFGTEFVPGDSIIIEFNTINTSRTIPFLIDEVGVSVNLLQESSRDFGDSGSCEVLMNCPEGANFQDEKKGIARILVKDGSSLFWCSGSLVNNTNRDGTPYFLTAHHCGEDASDEDYSQWLFFFNYESANCEMPALEPQHQSISGAKLIADGKKTSSGSDFKLLLLEEEIPEYYEPYFNGWSRSTSPSSNGTGIHHPDGDLKMVSTYTNPLVSTNYNNPEPADDGRFWKVVWSETQSGHGVTEGGSSGSPIFNPEGYIVGTLSGGRASCSKLTQPDYYGKFDVHWESNGTDSTEQLKPWLDPLGTDVPTLIGLDLDSSNIKADFDSDRTLIKVGEGIKFNDKSQGEITSHKWEFPGGEPEFVESSNPPLIYYYKTGDYNVKLVVKSSNESDSLTVVSYLRVVPNIYPNPSASGDFNITFGESIPEDIEIDVISMDGRQVQYGLKQSSENAVTVDLSAQPQGIYIIRLKTDDNTQIIKVANKTFTNSSK